MCIYSLTTSKPKAYCSPDCIKVSVNFGIVAGCKGAHNYTYKSEEKTNMVPLDQGYQDQGCRVGNCNRKLQFYYKGLSLLSLAKCKFLLDTFTFRETKDQIDFIYCTLLSKKIL